MYKLHLLAKCYTFLTLHDSSPYFLIMAILIPDPVCCGILQGYTTVQYFET